MIKIGILASGSGSNAEKIMEHFTGSSVARVALLVSDNPEAFAKIEMKSGRDVNELDELMVLEKG